jgi:thioredoxin-like negative regulator of GroEL
MGIEFTDKDFDNELNITINDKVSLIIGYTNQCHRCRDLINSIDNSSNTIMYGKVDLNKNDKFASFIALKYNLNTLNVPLIVLFKDGKFIKKIPNKFILTHILKEIDNL